MVLVNRVLVQNLVKFKDLSRTTFTIFKANCTNPKKRFHKQCKLHNFTSTNTDNPMFGYNILQNQIPALSRSFWYRFKNFSKTLIVFKDFPSLEDRREIQNFEGTARTLYNCRLKRDNHSSSSSSRMSCVGVCEWVWSALLVLHHYVSGDLEFTVVTAVAADMCRSSSFCHNSSRSFSRFFTLTKYHLLHLQGVSKNSHLTQVKINCF